MRSLTVLFDPGCELCRSAKDWLARQEALVALELVPAGSAAARARFPTLPARATLERLTVVADDGRVWRDDRAFVMCLWALRRYRPWAFDLAAAGRLSLARRFFRAVSRRRARRLQGESLNERNET